jgi:hypothetical protein
MESDVTSQEIPQKGIIGELEYSIFRVGAFRAAIELRLWGKIASGEGSLGKSGRSKFVARSLGC